MDITQKIMAVVDDWLPFVSVITSQVVCAAMMLKGKRQKAERVKIVKILTVEIVFTILLGLLVISLAHWVHGRM